MPAEQLPSRQIFPSSNVPQSQRYAALLAVRAAQIANVATTGRAPTLLNINGHLVRTSAPIAANYTGYSPTVNTPAGELPQNGHVNVQNLGTVQPYAAAGNHAILFAAPGS